MFCAALFAALACWIAAPAARAEVDDKTARRAEIVSETQLADGRTLQVRRLWRDQDAIYGPYPIAVAFTIADGGRFGALVAMTPFSRRGGALRVDCPDAARCDVSFADHSMFLPYWRVRLDPAALAQPTAPTEIWNACVLMSRCETAAYVGPVRREIPWPTFMRASLSAHAVETTAHAMAPLLAFLTIAMLAAPPIRRRKPTGWTLIALAVAGAILCGCLLWAYVQLGIGWSPAPLEIAAAMLLAAFLVGLPLRRLLRSRGASEDEALEKNAKETSS